MKSQTILVVNPGSTSTKIAVSDGAELVRNETLRHSAEELKRFPRIWEQYAFRLELCRQWAKEQNRRYDAVAALGGLLRSLEGGTYRVNEAMLADARRNLQGEHASNLGCAIAADLAADFECPAFVVDPVSVDEFTPLAYYSGHPRIKRRSLSHALNLHSIARKTALLIGAPLESSSFVIAHMGGGISVAPLKGGKIVDVNDAASDGPFSPERTGGLPLQPLITLSFSGEMKEEEVRSMVMGRGGLIAYLGTNKADEVEERIARGDAFAREVYEAMAYQISKEIGAMATVLHGAVDAIILTGGLAHSAIFTSWIRDRVKFIAPVRCMPGEDEMSALAEGCRRVLCGEEQERIY